MSTSFRKAVYMLGFLIGMTLFIQQLLFGIKAFRDLRFIANSYWLVLLVLITSLFSIAVRSLGWVKIMASLGLNLKWQRIISGFAVSFIPRYIPGSFWGYLSRSEWLLQSFNVPYKVSMYGSFLEIALAITTAVVVIAFSLAWQARQIVLLFVIPIIFVGAWIAGYFLIGNRAKTNITHENLSAGWGISYFGDRIVGAGALYSFSWLMNGASLMLISNVFAPLPQMGILNATMNYDLAWLAGFLIFFVPSGLGVREVAISGILSSSFPLSPYEASAIAVMLRILLMLGEFLWLLISIAIGKKNPPEKQLPVTSPKGFVQK